LHESEDEDNDSDDDNKKEIVKTKTQITSEDITITERELPKKVQRHCQSINQLLNQSISESINQFKLTPIIKTLLSKLLFL